MNEVIPNPPAAAGTDQHFCYGCGRLLHASATACPHCGAQQRAVQPANSLALGREVFCRACGAGLNAAAPLCPNCGAPQRAASTGGGDKSRIAAAILALFLGGFGIHKFYLGQTGLGVLYLLFCWTFVPALIGFIEAIVYLCMSDDSFARKYDR